GRFQASVGLGFGDGVGLEFPLVVEPSGFGHDPALGRFVVSAKSGRTWSEHTIHAPGPFEGRSAVGSGDTAPGQSCGEAITATDEGETIHGSLSSAGRGCVTSNHEVTERSCVLASEVREVGWVPRWWRSGACGRGRGRSVGSRADEARCRCRSARGGLSGNGRAGGAGHRRQKTLYIPVIHHGERCHFRGVENLHEPSPALATHLDRATVTPGHRINPLPIPAAKL